MEIFWFIVIALFFLSFVAYLVYRTGIVSPTANPSTNLTTRPTSWIVFEPRSQNPIRNLRTNRWIAFPAIQEKVTWSWIMMVFSLALAVGCLTGWLLFKVWEWVI